MCAGLLLMSGCGSNDDAVEPAPIASASTSASPAVADAATDTVVVDIAIKDGKATPQGARVDVAVGQEVTLRVTSDAADEIHVHSEPEHSYDVVPGGSKDFTFTVEIPGQVAVESHHLGVTIVQLVARS